MNKEKQIKEDEAAISANHNSSDIANYDPLLKAEKKRKKPLNQILNRPILRRSQPKI